MSNWTSKLCAPALLLGGILLLAGQCMAAVVFVVDNELDQIDDDTSDGICHTAAGTCTLRAAIMSANAATGAGATILLPAGTYLLTRPAAGADDQESGSLKLAAPSSGTPTIAIVGAGAAATIIDAGQIDRVLKVASPRTASIYGVTLRNGFVSGGDTGGGIFNDGSLTLTGCVVSDNEASGGGGGGIYVTSTAQAGLTLANTTLSGNKAQLGGGVYNFGKLSASGCTFSNNQALGGSGGGIYSQSPDFSLDHCTLNGNTAAGGGGGITNFDSAMLTYVDLIANHAGTFGGGMLNIGALSMGHGTVRGNIAATVGGGIFHTASGTTSAQISQSTISGNLAHQDGGGIWTDSAMFVTNATIASNSSDRNGGGVYTKGGTYLNANFYNTTIAYNDADDNQDVDGAGGGIFLDGTSVNGTNLYNSIVAGNFVGNQAVSDDCYSFNHGGLGTLNSHARNLFGNTDGCSISTVSGSYALLDSVALLGPLQANGGPTETIALLSGSNAIDGTIGGECLDSQSQPIAVDQRDVPRSDGACDVGAFEYQDQIFANGFENVP